MDESAPISLFAGTAQTKGLIGNATDETSLEGEKTRIQVYDYLTDLNGTFTGGTAVGGKSSGYYINNVLQYVANGTPTWQFPSNRQYYWTKSGEHKFFAYLTTSPEGYTKWTWQEEGETTDPEVAPVPSFTSTSKTVTITGLKMTPATTQFDFLYSDIVTRTTNHNAVPLNMKHLFTALSVAVNTLPDEGICPDCGYQMVQDEESDEESGEWTCPECGYPDVSHEGAHVDPAEEVTIKVTSITITGLKTKRSATISFANDASAVNIVDVDDEQARSEPFTVTPSSAITLTEEAQPVMDYTLLWPQFEADITDDTTMSITYTLGNSTVPKTSGPIKLKNLITQMDAGKKYQILITIRQSSDLRFVVTVEELVNMNSSNEVFYFPS